MEHQRRLFVLKRLIAAIAALAALFVIPPGGGQECVAISERGGASGTTAADKGFNPYREINPFGVWEITGSTIAKANPAPETEPWPDAPLENGKRIVVTADTFYADPYPGETAETMRYIAMEYTPVSWDYIFKFRFSDDGQRFFCDRVPIHTVLAGFYANEISMSFKIPDSAIWFSDYDTALYTDYMYLYEMKRTETYLVPYLLPFTDVAAGAWYRKDIELAHKNHIINGRSKTLYFPEENITYAETVKIAVCLRQLFSSGTVNIENSAPVWYRGFMDVALIWGIVYEDMSDRANEQITRWDFVDILYNAMPENEYQSINDVRDNSIPDIRLDPDVPVTQKIYTFYRAGIIGGADSSGSLYPEDTLSRGEAAAILTRMLDPASRLISRIG